MSPKRAFLQNSVLLPEVVSVTDLLLKWSVSIQDFEEIIKDQGFPVYRLVESRTDKITNKTVYMCVHSNFHEYPDEEKYLDYTHVETYEYNHPEITWSIRREKEEGPPSVGTAEDLRVKQDTKATRMDIPPPKGYLGSGLINCHF